MSKDVSYARDDYTHSLSDWMLVDDVCEGARQVKSKGEAYLPKPNPTDLSEDNNERYKQYVLRAQFFNATGRTLEGLTGTVFVKVPQLIVPTLMQYVDKDVNGQGLSIYQQSQSALADTVKKGRIGLFVDYPPTQSSTTKKQQDEEGIRATINTVSAKSVINWRTQTFGAITRLSLVVISEQIEVVGDDGFSSTFEPQYRVLALKGGMYFVQIWKERKKDQGEGSEWYMETEYQPLNGKGKPWNEIPFIFIGAKNNDPAIDKSPLLDLANVNIGHYRNSADYEDSVYTVGQPQAWMNGLDTEWRTFLEKQGIKIGSKALLMLPGNGQFGFAQVEPNTLSKEAMDQKEKQMAELGARLVEKGGVVKTATEDENDTEVEHSVLSLASSNVSEAYTQALQWVAEFMNTDGDIEYTLNQEFNKTKLDPQMLMALVGAWQQGTLPDADLWTQYRKVGLIDPEKDDETIREEVANSDNGLGLDDAA